MGCDRTNTHHDGMTPEIGEQNHLGYDAYSCSPESPLHSFQENPPCSAHGKPHVCNCLLSNVVMFCVQSEINKGHNTTKHRSEKKRSSDIVLGQAAGRHMYSKPQRETRKENLNVTVTST